MANLKDVLPTVKDLEPSEDRILWRYTDIPSLIEILTYEYLPLITVSVLSDPAEGVVLKSMLSKVPGATRLGVDLVFDIYQKTTFTSSWCSSKEELAPMWDRFSDPNGVAIKTTAKRLLDCLLPHNGLDIRCIEYIPDDEMIDSGSSPDDILSQFDHIEISELMEVQRDLYFYKLSDFKDEREVRVFKCVTPPNISGLVKADGTNLHSLQQMINNFVIPEKRVSQVGIASMNYFITEIVISPKAHSGIIKSMNKLLESLNENRRSKNKPAFRFEVEESRRSMWF